MSIRASDWQRRTETHETLPKETIRNASAAAAEAPLEFRPDDFALRGGAEATKIDLNFASQNYWKEVRARFFANKGAVVALVLVVILGALALFGPGMSPYTYSEQNLAQKNFAPRIPGLEQLGIFDGDETVGTTTGSKVVNGYKEKGLTDVYYWFGSDVLGRDIWTASGKARRFPGNRRGGRGDQHDHRHELRPDQRLFRRADGQHHAAHRRDHQRHSPAGDRDAFDARASRGFLTIVFALMITEWIGMSRIARAEMLKLKEQEFVLASRTLGAGDFFIIFREILPNIVGQIITQLMFSIPTAIFTEAFLSFVGLGIPVPMCSLGSLISDAFKSFTTHPYQIIPPILVLALLMLCFNILADGLREAFDPKLKEM